MKSPRCLVALFIAVTSLNLGQAASEPRPERVTFDRQTLVLVKQDENSKEYIPARETLENWTKFAAIRVIPGSNDPAKVAADLIALLARQNPMARAETLADPKTGEHIVAYLTWPPDQSHVEYNVFKLTVRPEGGLNVQQYSIREYKDTVEFVKGLKPVRERLLRQMNSAGLRIRS